jgi:acetyl esterase/lipase
MRCLHAKLFLFLSILVSGVSLPAGTLFLDAVFEVQRTNNIRYGTGDVGNPVSGQIDLFLDLYQPVGESLPEKRPGIVFIHGGGFVGGDKGTSQLVRLCDTYARRGYVTVSINYRMTGDNPTAEPGPTSNGDLLQRAINAAAQDAAKAVRWMRDNAVVYAIDTQRIAIGGSSAGGYTSLFAGYQESTTIGRDAEVSVILDLWGGMGGGEFLIDADDPPVFIVHGTADPTVPISEAYNLQNRLVQLGIPHESYLLEGGGHGVWNYFWNGVSEGKTVERQCTEFFFTHLDLMQIHPATRLQPQVLEVGPQDDSLVWRFPTDSSFHYRVEGSTDMLEWGATPVPDFQGTGSEVELNLPSGSGHNFYRVLLLPGF